MEVRVDNKLLYFMIIIGIIFIMAAVATLVGCTPLDDTHLDKSISSTLDYDVDTTDVVLEATETIEPTVQISKELTEAPTISPSASPELTAVPKIKTVYLLDGATIEVPYDAEYCGSKKSEVFHYIWCDSVEDIKLDNFVLYDSVEDAVARGKRPCKKCEP